MWMGNCTTRWCTRWCHRRRKICTKSALYGFGSIRPTILPEISFLRRFSKNSHMWTGIRNTPKNYFGNCIKKVSIRTTSWKLYSWKKLIQYRCLFEIYCITFKTERFTSKYARFIYNQTDVIYFEFRFLRYAVVIISIIL